MQLLEERLDKAVLLRKRLWEDAVAEPLPAECVVAECIIAREQDDINFAVATVIDEIHEVDVDRAESLPDCQ